MPIGRLLLIILFAAIPALSAHAQASNDALDAGFAALQAGNGDKAAAVFRSALASDSDNPVALYGAGAAAHLQGRESDALVFLKKAVQVEPRLIQASALLGDIAYHQGDLTFAIKTYENALAQSPANAYLRERLAAWRSEATVHNNLEAFKDDRFTILFSGPANQKLAARATTVLRNAFWGIGRTVGAYPSTAITVVLYTDKQFHDITGAPEWAGGGFDGQIRMPVAGATQNLIEFDRILTHELSHAMLASIATRNVPAWLNEGLAMYFEGNDAAESERTLASARAYVPLGRLQTGYGGLTAAQANAAYEMSAFATSALLTRIGPANLGILLQDLDKGLPLDTAVQRFGFTVGDFERELAKRVGVQLK